MKQLIYLFLLLLVFGCSKPDPEPEKKDPIYQDLLVQKGLAEKDITDVKAKVEEHRLEISKVKPQTGQIKYAQKRFWEAQRALDALEQQKKYWEIRILERAKHARIEYLTAFQKGETWPKPQEFDEYMTEKRLRLAKKQWDWRQRKQLYESSIPKDKIPEKTDQK